MSGRERLKGEVAWMGKRARKFFKRFYKRLINRMERKKAKQDPECQPEYKRYEGYMD